MACGISVWGGRCGFGGFNARYGCSFGAVHWLRGRIILYSNRRGLGGFSICLRQIGRGGNMGIVVRLLLHGLQRHA